MLSTVAIAGCAAGDDTLDPDEPVASDESAIGGCDDHFVFSGGRFRVCWRRHSLPAGQRGNTYQVRNATGRRRHVRIALNNWFDTTCRWIGPGELETYPHLFTPNVPGVGKPEGVKDCD
jgi:hypothetical protein